MGFKSIAKYIKYAKSASRCSKFVALVDCTFSLDYQLLYYEI